MANVYKYIVLIAGLSLLLTLAGFPTITGVLLEKVGLDIANNPENVNISNFASTILAIFAIAASVGIGISIVTRTSPVPFLVAGFATILAGFSADLISVTQYAMSGGSWMGYVVGLIMVPLAIGYLFAIINWWKSIA